MSNKTGPTHNDDPDYFWAKIDVRGPEDCWVAKSVKTHNHGGFAIVEWEKRPQPAHKVAYELTFGRVLLGFNLRRRAGCPPDCCNPKHWTPVGSPHGRIAATLAPGERPKLTRELAQEIRARFRSYRTSTVRMMAREYNLSVRTVWNIVHKGTWS
jgi:hypothetical protein